MLRWGWALSAAAGLAAMTLSACAIVDQFSPRAVEFNLQAEKTQQHNILLNVVRASLRHPMQFTGLSSITGTASASGSVTGGYTHLQNWPLIRDFGLIPPASSTALAGAITRSGGATASMSGGPTFTVPVLDTQEFYSGILRPLTPQIIDYYVQLGFHPEILFDLFVDSVEVAASGRGSACERFTFRNNVRDAVEFAQFQALAEYLIGSGFTSERVSDSRRVGFGIRVAPRAKDMTEAARMVEVLTQAASSGLDVREDRGTLQLRRRATRVRMCFARPPGEKPTWLGNIPESAFCGYIRSQDGRERAARRDTPQDPARARARGCIAADTEPGVTEGGVSQFQGIELSDVFIERIREIHRRHARGYHSPELLFPYRLYAKKPVVFKFHVRSVEGILYYLGEITRRYHEQGLITQVKTDLRYGTMPLSDCEHDGVFRRKESDLIRLDTKRRDRRSYRCENLFVVDKNAMGDAFFSVTYDGVSYSVPRDPQRAGRTLQVLELVKQLLALHTSAKELPQSGIISVVGGQ